MQIWTRDVASTIYSYCPNQEIAMKHICIYGKWKNLKRILFLRANILHKNDASRFYRMACNYGHATIVFLLWKHNIVMSLDSDNYLSHACHCGRLRFVQLVVEKGILQLDASCFYAACTNNHLKLAHYIWSVCNETLHDRIYVQIFLEICSKGYWKIAHFLLTIKKQDPTFFLACKNSSAFCYACENGHLAIVRILYQWNLIHWNNHLSICGFENACYRGHLDVVRFLWSLHVFSTKNIDRNFLLSNKRTNIVQFFDALNAFSN